MKEPGGKKATGDGERKGGVGEKRERREEKMKTGTANKPTDKNRRKKEKNEAELVVQREAVGSVRKVGRGSKQGA